MNTVVVKNSTEFKLALNNAKKNLTKTILLDSVVDGITHYAPPGSTALHFDDELFISSLDSKNPSTVGFVNLNNVRGLRIEKINIVNQTALNCVNLLGSQNISFKNCNITANHDPNVLPLVVRGGLFVRNCKSISADNCVINRVGTGIGVLATSGLSVTNSFIYETIQDCMNVGSNSEFLFIDSNRFIGQSKLLEPDHHYDMLQFWAQTDSVQDLQNVVITNNHFIADSLDVTPQAIFGRADYGTNPAVLRNFIIKNNFILSRHGHGISLAESSGCEVAYNTLMYVGPTENLKTVNIPGIAITKSSNYTIHHNYIPDKYGYPAIDNEFFYQNVRYRIATNA